ncbi:MAG: DNA-directed DNA polymerase [marine bacterium B5-7]|nr:MAG: DNA-directed DNA polymerase [marine bacterium B5-7]
MSTTPAFVHLRVHSEYSLADSIVRVKTLPEAVRRGNMPAVAVTDLMNFYAAIKFYRASVDAGIKPIMGLEAQIADGAADAGRLVLLCRNNRGFESLSSILTKAHMAPRQGIKVVAELDWFRDCADDLIAIAAGQDGDLARALLSGTEGEATRVLDRYRGVFGERFVIDVSRIGKPREEAHIAAALDLADRHGIAAVATNPVQFVKPDEFDAHDVRVCIHEGRVLNDPRRVQRFTNDQYLRTPEEMAALFPDHHTLLDNTVEIARQCNVFFDFNTSHMPAYPSIDELSEEECLRQDSESGLAARIADKSFANAEPGLTREDYLARLERELNVINGMGFPGYFLIVADFIRWARENDIPVGPGRGSGAGSLVAWSLGITDLDPLEYGLLFERFLNPERVSLPDFDIDFCMDRRDEVIDYVSQRYGADRVSQIITYGTMAARAVVRDVGRVMGHPYGFVDTLAKLVPFEIGITLEKALEDEPALKQRYDDEEEVSELINTAITLEGLPRNVGKHAGGVVISPDDISRYVPLYVEPGMSQPVTQFDKDDLEAIGLVKFDFLGLRTLTVIHNAVNMINEARDTPLDISMLALDDSATYEFIKSGRTTGVFQLESRGMKDIITRLLPDRFADLVALVALFRPGPLQSGMVEDFINRKHGREKNEYPHASLEEVLEPTYGVILYQEQVMQIAQELSGYTLGSADLLRRAMGKKKPEEMASQRAIFIAGAENNQVPAKVAGYIFDLVEKFAGYGFNKSHSAAYAMLTYQTAWLKTHYPAEFMAAALSADMEHTDKVVILISEARSLGLDVYPPDVNQCYTRFRPISGQAVYYGLGALKGVGGKAVDSIVEEREANGPYKDLFDFCRRVSGQRINKRVMEALIRGGALDCLDSCRATLMNSLPDALNLADKEARDADSGQDDMFGLGAANTMPAKLRRIDEWSDHERLTAEKEVLGLYLTGHPFEPMRSEVETLVDGDLVALKPEKDRDVVVAGLVSQVRTMKTKRGDTIAFVTLDDNTARIEVSVFSRLYPNCRHLLRNDSILVVRGSTELDDFSGNVQMRANQIFELSDVRLRWLQSVDIAIGADDGSRQSLRWLSSKLRQGIGATHVKLCVETSGGHSGYVPLGAKWRLGIDEEFCRELKRCFGDRLKFQYDRAGILLWQGDEQDAQGQAASQRG